MVTDAKHQDLIAEVAPTIYFSYPQHQYPSGSALVISTRIDPEAAVPRLYQWLREFEPYVAIVNVLPYTEVVRGLRYSQRMNAELFSSLAVLGLVIAAAGLFAVVSLAASRRIHEVGIRMSLGAQRAEIGRLMLFRAMTPVAAGIAIGLIGSTAVTRLLRGLLYGVEPNDPATILIGASLLASVALIAAILPARRAAAADPMDALRSQ